MSGEQLTREIGRSGVKASAVGLGTWAIGGWMWGGTDEAQSIAAIQASLDAGVTLIDTAPAYGLGRSEEIVGKALAGRRDKAVIATKCGLVWHTQKGNHFFDQDGKPVHRYLGRDSIVHEVEESLRRLGTDHIDLYITHWQDPTTPIEETVAALEELKQAGKIRAIGASNVDRSELEQYTATGSLDAIQERFSMIDRQIEADLLPLTIANGVSTLSYSSLALGLLSGAIGPERVFSGDDQRKDNPRFSVANRRKAKDFAEAIRPVAERQGASIAQTVIAWTLAQPGITFALCGARNPAHALDNARAGTLRLSTADLAAIDTAISAQLATMDG
ncbi:aldo/keto reductase [Rhizobium lentis]|uniref:Aryl-alcohol dehydrogenase-like predicted oxidoreductase n=1 Tax=Rhizobium lentis TaxID=1138194 RepID=A0A7W8XFF1_9HYPH|nr:aldo/keto reductase [Rhizobium lentis]MBB4574828.1 aryl-alcohol dehydrogenase-like predicted oxidoreductase [Rhizobium lentis]MBB5550755.1 aryl-alcohol dehydrogenase-like predicted oxidoreductase [Rhizobium lentis]MBB5561123.1 aryl-alcohol dehydrogenase-like predicted oxidoreductase [Rhizobium lentis]MBB5567874.1 aryl-alcohol dehydrogenase-like predicted oxidoreductase [Rhizobium lentis]